MFFIRLHEAKNVQYAAALQKISKSVIYCFVIILLCVLGESAKILMQCQILNPIHVIVRSIVKYLLYNLESFLSKALLFMINKNSS